MVAVISLFYLSVYLVEGCVELIPIDCAALGRVVVEWSSGRQTGGDGLFKSMPVKILIVMSKFRGADGKERHISLV